LAGHSIVRNGDRSLGIHSRIDERIRHITGRMRVGNAYVNRNQIGAVVGVQPFGGEGLSGTGPKAGGPRSPYRFAIKHSLSTCHGPLPRGGWRQIQSASKATIKR
jgi:delta 1-pyrroline-5-carboxylate dehydrogenase